MGHILLSDHEIRRFSAWCKQQAESNKQIEDQLKKLGMPGELIAKHQRSETEALLAVAHKLDHTESFTVE